MADVYLVCEGPADGLDVRVLDAIIATKLGIFVQIVPAGGDRNLNGVRTYFQERSRRLRRDGQLGTPEDVALAIEDRNFRPRSEVEATWSKPGGRKLIWHRHEIENYLLEPRLLLCAFNGIRQQVAGLPKDEESIASLLATIARSKLEEHAALVLRWDLYVRTTNGNPSEFRAPEQRKAAWTQTEWLEALQNEAQRIRTASRKLVTLPELDPDEIEKRYHEILATVRQRKFIDDGDYRIDMKGKWLLEELITCLNSQGAHRLKKEILEGELINAISAVYEKNTLFDPDEFALLGDRLIAWGATG